MYFFQNKMLKMIHFAYSFGRHWISCHQKITSRLIDSAILLFNANYAIKLCILFWKTTFLILSGIVYYQSSYSLHSLLEISMKRNILMKNKCISGHSHSAAKQKRMKWNNNHNQENYKPLLFGIEDLFMQNALPFISKDVQELF